MRCPASRRDVVGAKSSVATQCHSQRRPQWCGGANVQTWTSLLLCDPCTTKAPRCSPFRPTASSSPKASLSAPHVKRSPEPCTRSPQASQVTTPFSAIMEACTYSVVTKRVLGKSQSRILASPFCGNLFGLILRGNQWASLLRDDPAPSLRGALGHRAKEPRQPRRESWELMTCFLQTWKLNGGTPNK